MTQTPWVTLREAARVLRELGAGGLAGLVEQQADFMNAPAAAPPDDALDVLRQVEQATTPEEIAAALDAARKFVARVTAQG